MIQPYIAICQGDSFSVSDPVKNRLLTMSTGGLARTGSVFVGTHDLIAYQIGWVPIDFVQLSVSANLMYSSGAAKFLIIESKTYQPGLAIGFEATSEGSLTPSPGTNMYAVNAASSLPIGTSTFHINLVQPIDPSGQSVFNVPTLMQLGYEHYKETGSSRQTKFMAEVWLVNKYKTDFYGLESKRFGITAFFLGIRNFGEVFIYEFGIGSFMTTWPIGKSSNDEFNTRFFPYFSLTWSL